LPEAQRLILFVAELIKDGFLNQSAFDEKDMYCAPERQIVLLRIMLTIFRRGQELIRRGTPLARIRELSCVPMVLRAKSVFGNAETEALAAFEQQVNAELNGLAQAAAMPGGMP